MSSFVLRAWAFCGSRAPPFALGLEAEGSGVEEPRDLVGLCGHAEGTGLERGGLPDGRLSAPERPALGRSLRAPPHGAGAACTGCGRGVPALPSPSSATLGKLLAPPSCFHL